ncbi:MAG TPA: winged helix DNA-binding domain-containing protein [Thermomicrobiales bacterium]|nr:winged helix DNA-binding domain-containing protein [Thermomicrobiales bacterium]
MSRPHPQPGVTLTLIQLNRALLARQHLLQRTGSDASTVIAHLVGMQSQVPRDPFIGLWSRVEGFQTDDLDRLMLDRLAVRHTLMRGTIHLTTADDAFALQPVIAPVVARAVYGSKMYMSGLGEADPVEVAEAGRRLLEQRPLTAKQLGEHLAQQFPGSTPNALATFTRMLVPAVQVTPRGTWNGTQQATFATTASWLGRLIEPNGTVEDVIRRYLRAFGPATVADIQAWSGLTGLRTPVDRMRHSLVAYRNERGRELFDVEDGVFADPESPAPVRFLPGYDNLTLSHADRTRVIDDAVRKALWTPNGAPNPVFLVDGRVAGAWKVEAGSARTKLALRSFFPVSQEVRIEALQEGRRLLDFLAPETEGQVEFVDG